MLVAFSHHHGRQILGHKFKTNPLQLLSMILLCQGHCCCHCAHLQQVTMYCSEEAFACKGLLIAQDLGLTLQIAKRLAEKGFRYSTGQVLYAPKKHSILVHRFLLSCDTCAFVIGLRCRHAITSELDDDSVERKKTITSTVSHRRRSQMRLRRDSAYLSAATRRCCAMAQSKFTPSSSCIESKAHEKACDLKLI